MQSYGMDDLEWQVFRLQIYSKIDCEVLKFIKDMKLNLSL